MIQVIPLRHLDYHYHNKCMKKARMEMNRFFNQFQSIMQHLSITHVINDLFIVPLIFVLFW